MSRTSSKMYLYLMVVICLSTVLEGFPQERQTRNAEAGPHGPQTSCPQMELLIGRDGRDGQTGPQGEKGERGETGGMGPQGMDGDVGPEGPIGLQGSPGPHGEQGSPSTYDCGQTYIRWGKTTCPQNQSTELVYSGRAGGSYWSKTGGATNYLCMPDNPDYLRFSSGVQGPNYVYGVEYEPRSGQPLYDPNVYAHNAPCAVCRTVSRCSLLMIPAKTQCPTSWTTEYIGYLMSAWQTYSLPTEYVCVDKNPGSVSGLDSAAWFQGSGIFAHVEASCNGMACPPYVAGRELTCVVCSR